MSFFICGSRVLVGGALLGALGVFAGGCSSDSEKGSSLSVDEFVRAMCEEYVPCCEASGLPADSASCRTFYNSALSRERFDGAAASACLDEFRSATDRCVQAIDTPSCDRAFAVGNGTKQPGEECDSVDDCAAPKEGTATCGNDFDEEAATQKCQVLRAGVVGSSPCIATRSGAATIHEGKWAPSGYSCDIGSGLACESESHSCQPLPDAGEPCLSGAYCVTSAYCDFAVSMCRRRAARGESCTDGSCVATAYCDPDSRTCAALQPTDAACTDNIECLSNSCLDGKCEAELNLAEQLLCGE